ncbi:DUF1876 domain-containing protein [Nocardioides sp.]|uniref:DUF1876 domain-containing protein n=1 Tax=Nocardioides sp. TaxID=35761 RepID=UPI003784B54B
MSTTLPAPTPASLHTRTWHLHIDLFERGTTTRAEAVLVTDVGTELRHVGEAHCRPGDRDVPEIGDELATCRALSGLAHDLLEATLADISANAPEPARVRSGSEPGLYLG